VQQVIAANLQSAQAALAAGNYVEPAESSAVRYFSTVLTLDPANVQARQGMEQAADHLANAVKQFIVEGRLAEAGIALERLRGITTDQRRASLLDAQLRKEQANQLLALSSHPSVPVDTDRSKAAPSEKSGETAAVPVRKAANASPREARVEPASEVASPATAVAIREASHPLPAVTTEVNTPATELPAMAAVVEPEPTPMPVATAPAATMVAAAVPASVTPPEPKLIKLIQPEYPGEARMRDIEGWVDVTLSVDAAGHVADARIESSSRRMFNKAALAAVRKWQYEPRTLPSPDSTQLVQVRVTFRLEEE
jgi:TonB family protein